MSKYKARAREILNLEKNKQITDERLRLLISTKFNTQVDDIKDLFKEFLTQFINKNPDFL